MIAELTKKDKLVGTLSSLDFSSENEHFEKLREAARVELEGLDFPTSRDEYWKYTRVGKIINKEYVTGTSEEIDINPYLIPELDANIIVLVNGYCNAALSTIEANSEIKVLSLLEGKNKGEIIKNYFGNSTSDKEEVFLALNNAYHTDGVCIHVSKNAVGNKPYHIINIITGSSIISQTRNFILAEKGSSIKVIESFVNLEGNENFVNNVSEFFVQENANVEYNKIQDAENDNYHISTEQVYQEANSNFTINTATFSGALVRNNLNIVVDASNCETNLNGLYLGKDKNHIDNHTIVDHKKPHCNSNEVYKGVLDNDSTGVFNGKVFVRQDAQITNAFQQNNNILLSDNASVNSKPELEIYADDVKCSHGSTTGQIDEEAIFYLQSRGISKRNAINLMINAFAKDALERISIEPLSSFIDRKIEERFTNND
jgi:Fe-S cluster assembly protein SufD